MKLKFESKGGFDNVLKWLGKTSSIQSNIVKNIADYGTNRLSDGTPEDTGETASGWKHDIVTKPNSVEISWKNTAHPESEVNVAKLIELGHGTRTGGYVAPRPYIKRSMEPVWKRLDKEIEELMK
jgi:hypothetical protein